MSSCLSATRPLWASGSAILSRLGMGWIAGTPSPTLLSQTTAVTAPALARGRASWRYQDVTVSAAWPNYKPHLTHRRHWHAPHTWGLQAGSKVRCVDNSKIGREAMAEGKPPK